MANDDAEYYSADSLLDGAVFWGAKYVDAGHTSIDMMLAHPIYGEIPIAINADEYPALWADVVASGDVEPYTPPSDDEKRAAFRATATLSRASFCTKMLEAGLLTRADAIAAAKGDWPEAFAAALSSMTEAEADAALILWAGAATVERNHPLLDAVRLVKGVTQEELDDLFGYQP